MKGDYVLTADDVLSGGVFPDTVAYGGWGLDDHDPEFMQIPIISDIVETLELYEDGTTAYSTLSAAKKAAYDTALRAIIDYVDGDTETAPQYKGVAVSQNDIAKIRAAIAKYNKPVMDKAIEMAKRCCSIVFINCA